LKVNTLPSLQAATCWVSNIDQILTVNRFLM
jgi:hypothetical protein